MHTDVLLVACRETGLKENAGKAMYTLIFQQQNERQYKTLRNVINHSKSQHISNICEQHHREETANTKKLNATYTREMPATIQSRIFCLAVVCLKMQIPELTELQICLFLHTDVELGFSH
jgi:hypothetical protein